MPSLPSFLSFTISLIPPPASLSGSHAPLSLSLSFSLIYIPRPLASRSTCLLLSLSLPFTHRRRTRKAKARRWRMWKRWGRVCSFSSMDQTKGRKMFQEIRSYRVDREAKEDRERDLYWNPCEIHSVSGWVRVEDILVVLSSTSCWWGRFRIWISGWIKTPRLSLQTWLIELLDWSRQSLSFWSLTLAFQN